MADKYLMEVCEHLKTTKQGGWLEKNDKIHCVSVMTETEIYSVQYCENWTTALGELLGFRHLFPEHQLIAFFIGNLLPYEERDRVAEILEKYDIRVCYGTRCYPCDLQQYAKDLVYLKARGREFEEYDYKLY